MTRVALIAHDEKKPDIVELVKEYESVLSTFDLVGTGTTGERIATEATEFERPTATRWT